MLIPKPIEIPTSAAAAEASAAAKRTIATVAEEETLVPGVSGVVTRQPALGPSFSPKKRPTWHPVDARLHWRWRHRVVGLDHGRDLVGAGIGDGNAAAGIAASKDAEAFRGGHCNGVSGNENVHHHRHEQRNNESAKSNSILTFGLRGEGKKRKQNRNRNWGFLEECEDYKFHQTLTCQFDFDSFMCRF